MPRFMEACACDGKRPEGVVSRRRSRPDLIARLLRNRHVARCLVAPTGFGKSTLAFEYADIVFGFKRTFWINARSPCFLRDLDAGVLLSSILDIDSSPHLIVCEDLPRLDSQRAAEFGDLVDALLDAGVEVLLTCVPSADALADVQRDRILISGEDLLLDDAEMELDEREGAALDQLKRAYSPIERIACVRWSDTGAATLVEGIRAEELTNDVRLIMFAMLALGRGSLEELRAIACVRWSDTGAATLVEGIRAEELTNDVRLIMFAMLALGRGSLEELRAIASPERVEEIAHVAVRSYPLLGVDARSRGFHAVEVGVEELARAFGSRIDDLAAMSVDRTRDALCARIGDALAARGDAERACSFMASFATKKGALDWLRRAGWSMVFAGFGQLADARCEALGRSSSTAKSRLSSLQAWAAVALGEPASACAHAQRALRSEGSSFAERCRAHVVLLRFGDSAQASISRDFLGGACAASPDKMRSGDPCVLAPDGDMDWPALASLALEAGGGAEKAASAWISRCDAALAMWSKATANALLLSAGWILEDGRLELRRSEPISPEAEAGAQEEGRAVRMARGVAALLERAHAEGALGWCALGAARALEACEDSFSGDDAPVLSVDLEKSLRSLKLDDERRCASRVRERAESASGKRTAARADEPEPQTRIPRLRVTLFGGVEIRRGDEDVPSTVVTRRREKTLLAVLVINRGKEMSRDRLASVLWPVASAEAARKNLYSVMSQLRKALSLEGGACPYLVSTRSGCKLDMRYVESDVYEIGEVCRDLLFGRDAARSWERLYARVRTDFAEDLMPAENACEFICSARDRYRMQLVDGLVAASARLVREGEERGALWFAHEALERDRSREDAYAALMEAQIAAGQRGAAIESYFACRRYLSEELGIDPSPRVVNLYRSVIETEADFS